MSIGKRYVSFDDVDMQVFDWGSLSFMSEPKVTGTENMSAAVVILQPGKGHSWHNHEGCEELLYVIEGVGDQAVEEGGKKLEKRVTNGDLVHIPPSAFHSTVNVGTTPMVILAIYQLPQMEAIFRELPGCKIVPAKNKG